MLHISINNDTINSYYKITLPLQIKEQAVIIFKGDNYEGNYYC